MGKAQKDIERAYKRLSTEPWGFTGTITRKVTEGGVYDPQTGVFTPQETETYPVAFIFTTEFLAEGFRQESSEQRGMQEEERVKHNLLVAAKGIIPRKDDIIQGTRFRGLSTEEEVELQIIKVLLNVQTAAIRCYAVLKSGITV